MTDVEALARQDAHARAQALDVTRSWLVQAPAGSGKTELLIARFLALLAIVERPESIVAMTFTRKAAAEMRERVVEALRAANEDDSLHVPDAPHSALTRRLAHEALARDRAHGWRLIEQPSRLRIITIDAMATALARQAPLASELGALPRFIDDAELLYGEAAREALAAAPAGDPHWQTFLKWLDNDAMTANRLIAQMLAAPAVDAHRAAPYLLRAHQPGDMGWIVHRHAVLYAREWGYNAEFEALAARICADFLDHFDPAREHCWVAERNGAIVGSVFLVRKSKTVAKLRLLLVEPEARGLGIGRRLIDECIRFARAAGYAKITLWTQSDLDAARRLYQQAGFRRVHTKRHDSFGRKGLVAETWDLRLSAPRA